MLLILLQSPLKDGDISLVCMCFFIAPRIRRMDYAFVHIRLLFALLCRTQPRIQAENGKDRRKGTFVQKPEQLAVSAAVPTLPASNCIWVTWFRGRWRLITWLPIAYRAPSGQDICAVCTEIMNSSEQAIHRVDMEFIVKCQLEHLPTAEADPLWAKYFLDQLMQFPPGRWDRLRTPDLVENG
jgi:hypothetical protein